LAGMAVIVDPVVTDIAFLDELAARNLIYDVVFEQDANPETLARYQIVLAAPSVPLPSEWRRYEDVMPAELEAAAPGQSNRPRLSGREYPWAVARRSLLVHLLNYADTPVLDIDLKVRGRFSSARLFCPDIDPRPMPVSSNGQFKQIRIPELRIYDLVVLDP
jgi:hypothetical protein